MVTETWYVLADLPQIGNNPQKQVHKKADKRVLIGFLRLYKTIDFI